MGDWKHTGSADGFLSWISGGCGHVRDEYVEKDGETRKVFTVGDQTVGDAIANGQFYDKDDDNDDDDD